MCLVGREADKEYLDVSMIRNIGSIIMTLSSEAKQRLVDIRNYLPEKTQ